MKYYAIKRPDGSWIMRSVGNNRTASWERAAHHDDGFIGVFMKLSTRIGDVETIEGYTCVEVSGFVEVGMPANGVWRTIESAPKDGTAILLHNNIAPGNVSGRMESCDGGNAVVGEWWASDKSDRDADGFGDWICYMDAIEDPRCPFDPTHWMPLPAAPEVKP